MNLKELEQHVSKGLVLNKDGQWRPVDEVVDEESDYISHLENGEVLDNGRWVKLDDIVEKDSYQKKEDQAIIQEEKDFQEKIVKGDSLPEEDEKESSLPDEKNVAVATDVTQKDETQEADTQNIPQRMPDTVRIEDPSRVLEKKIETLETELTDIEHAEQEESETKPFEVKPAELEESQTKVLPKPPSQITKSKEELSKEESSEAEVSEERSSDILEFEKSSVPQEQSSNKKNVSTSDSLDAWDRARSKKIKYIILSGMGIGIIILIVILKLLL